MIPFGEILTKLVSWWPKLPKELRFVLMVGIIGGLITGGTVVGYQMWKSGYIEERLGGVATNAHISATFDTLRSETAQQSALIVNAALFSYTDSLRVVRKNAEDSILKPMLRNLLELNRRLLHVEKVQGITNDNINTLSNSTNEQIDRLLRRAEQDDTKTSMMDKLNTIIEQLNDQAQRIEQMEKKRVSKQKF